MNWRVPLAWQGGGDGAWAHRLQAWQRELNRFSKRSRFVFLGGLAGLGLAWLAGGDLIDEHLELVQSVEQVMGQLKAPLTTQGAGQAVGQAAGQVVGQPAVPPGAAASDAQHTDRSPEARLAQADIHRLPGQQTVARVWPDLQQALSQQGLRVASLRPLPEALAAPLPSQSVAVRLSGRFADWQRAWASLSAAGPVWSLERLSVVPQPSPIMPGPAMSSPAARDAVQIDAVLRVWLRPGSHGPNAWPGVVPQTPQHARVDDDKGGSPAGGIAPLFAMGLTGMGTAAAPFAAPTDVPTELPSDASVPPVLSASKAGHAAAALALALPADPMQWPLARLRLAGIWQHGDERQAVLAAGPHVVRVRTGQRVAKEGLWVEWVMPGSVQLRSSGGTRHVLNLEGGAP